MAFNNGPKIDTNGLVFAFDRETPRAFRGEPTVNIIADPLPTTGWTISHYLSSQGSVSFETDSDGPYLQFTDIVRASGSPDYPRINASSNFNPVIPAGTTYSVSFDAKSVDACELMISILSYGSTKDNYTTPPLTTEWTRYSFENNVNNSFELSLPYFRFNTDTTSDTKVRNIQIEFKDHATPFTTTQRLEPGTYTDLSGYGSVINTDKASYTTESLLRISGSTGVRAESLSLPQSGMYDGIFATSGSFTVDIWANKYEVQPATNPILFYYTSTLLYPTIGIIHYQSTTSSTSTTDYGFIMEYSDNASGDSATGGSIISNRGNVVNTLGWHCYTVVYDVTGTSHTGSIYHDGTLIKAVSASVAYQWAKPVAPRAGGPLFCLNNSGSAGIHQFNGEIGSIKIYNKALSSTEILNNYKQLKGRFD